MKKTLGVVLLLIGIALGVYVGLWVCFVGGILGLVQVINGLINGSGLDGMLIVWSVLKIMFAGLLGYLSAMFGIVPALVMLKR